MSYIEDIKLGKAMIGKEEFKKLIEEYYEQNKRIDKLCEIFPDSFGDPIFDWGFRMFNKLLDSYFDEIGRDWISYYLYENPEKRYYQDDEEMPLETLDDLWVLIESHRK